MFRPRRFVPACSLLLALGCGSGDSEPPLPVYPVNGTVTYNGQPLVGADLTFSNAEVNRSAFGRTNDRGEYQLTTFSANDGAVAGKHVVTIIKVEAPPPTPALAPVESEEYVPPGLGQPTEPAKTKSLFPEKFGNQATSGLIAVINQDVPNRVDFELKD